MKPMGRPRILNNPDIPKNHVCEKCKKDNTEVSFRIRAEKISRLCNPCKKNNKIPQHDRQENIVNRINSYQGL